MRKFITILCLIAGLTLAANAVGTGCQTCFASNGCQPTPRGGWHSCYWTRGICTVGSFCGKNAVIGLNTPNGKLQNCAATLPSQSINLRWELTHHWITNADMLVDLAVGDRTEAAETLRTVTILQNQIAAFVSKPASDNVIRGYGRGVNFVLQMERSKDTLTIQHSTGTVETIVFEGDKFYRSTAIAPLLNDKMLKP